jgi:hypothetical protein
MATKKANNTLIGRKCVIDYACRWKNFDPHAAAYAEEQRKEYAKRDDFGKTGEIVSYEPNDESGKSLVILRDDTGQIQSYYQGEVTITGPAPNPEADLATLLIEIRDILKAYVSR